MSKRHRIVGSTGLVALLAAIVSGCAELQAALVEAECNPDAAYAAGMNDGKNGEDMNAYYANDCPPDAGIQAAYRSGYQFGLAHSTSGTSTTPAAHHQCVSSFGNKVCGYHCKKSGSEARCASTPDQFCVKGGFDEIACGYNCVKTDFAVRCAKRPKHNCVSDMVGSIKCGRNCRIEYGSVQCDSEES